MTKPAARLDRRALFASGAAAALLAASGVSAHGAPQKGGRLRIAVSGGARDDSWVSGDGLFMQVARQGLVFDTLTEIAADGTLRGELATGWRSDRDGYRWSFDLREGVSFHDGRPFRAHDVVASLSPDLDVVVINDHRIEIILAVADPHLPLKLAGVRYVIRPAHAPNEGIGTGLYAVRDFNPGQRLVTRRVKDHFKDGVAGWFDEVELTSISADAVRIQAVAEYLVDAVDIADAALVRPIDEAIWQPSRHAPVQVVSRAIGQPARVGARMPLDDLRAAERWWFA